MNKWKKQAKKEEYAIPSKPKYLIEMIHIGIKIIKLNNDL